MRRVITATLLATATVAAIGSASPSWAWDWPGRLAQVAAGLESPSAAERVAALNGLVYFDPDDVRPLITPHLRDPDPQIRLAALAALSQVGSRSDAELVHPMLSDPNEAVRLQSVETLARIGGETSLAPLSRALGDSRPPVREAAVKALGSLALPDGLVSVSDRLGDLNRNVVVAAIDVLGRSGDRTFVFALLEKTRDPSHLVQARAVDALARLGDDRAVLPIAALLHDAHPLVQLAAIDALGRLGDRRASGQLVRLLWLEEGEDEKGRTPRVLAALGRIGDPATAEAVIQVLRFRTEFAEAAADALKSMGPGIIPAMLEALVGAGEFSFRLACLDVLAHVQSEDQGASETDRQRVAATLIPLLRSEQYPQRDVVAALLSGRHESAVEPLLQLLEELVATPESDSEDKALLQLQGMILDGLRGAADERVVKPVSRLFPRLAPAQREAAIRLLGEIASPEAMPLLRGVIEDRQSQRERRLAIVAISRVDGPVAARVLLELLDEGPIEHLGEVGIGLGRNTHAKTPNHLADRLDELTGQRLFTVLRALADHLRRRRQGDVVEAVFELAFHDDERIAARALDSLGPLGPPDADVADMTKLYTNGSTALRAKIVQVIGDWRDDRYFALVEKAAADRSPIVRGEAAWALGQLGDPRAVPLLLELLNDRPWPVGINAAASLGRVEGNETTVVDRLETALETSPHGPVRANALMALYRRGAAPGRHVLRRHARRDRDPRVREVTYRILAQRGKKADLVMLRSERENSVHDSDKRFIETLLEKPRRAQGDNWVRYLLTRRGQPEQARRVLVSLPDGTMLARMTDAAGEVRVEHLTPGDTRVFFLDNVVYRPR